MAKRFFMAVTISICLITGAYPLANAQTTQAGVIGVVLGSAEVTAADGQKRAIKNGDPIYLGDEITTQEDGHLQVLLMDQTVFTLGPSSGVVVDEFVYDSKSHDGKLTAKMIKGFFRVVSGQIAHKKPEDMNVNLPAGTIGFRGTVVAGEIEGVRSLVILMGAGGSTPESSGKIFVSNRVDGKETGVWIDEKGYGTIIDGPNMAPAPVFKIPEAKLIGITLSLKGATPGKNGAQTGASFADNGDIGQTAQMMSLMSRMEEFAQKAAQGGMITPTQPAMQPLPTGRDDDQN